MGRKKNLFFYRISLVGLPQHYRDVLIYGSCCDYHLSTSGSQDSVTYASLYLIEDAITTNSLSMMLIRNRIEKVPR